MEKKTDGKTISKLDLRIYIDTHLMDDLNQESLADHYGYSVERFRKLFKCTTGTTLHRYIRLRRMQYAAKLIRLGASVQDAFAANRYMTVYSFSRAFYEVFGVSPYEYAATKGRVLMTEPKLETRPAFYSIGYAFEAIPDLNWMESGAYWQGQLFPPFDPEEFARIGAGPAEACVWVRRGDSAVYVFGSEVAEKRYEPPTMQTVRVPGGDFLVFRVPFDADNDVVGENIRATWFYAYEQWLPQSDYAVDWDRLPYEYYLEDDRLICIPVKPGAPGEAPEDPAEHPASEHPPALLRGGSGLLVHWDMGKKA